MRELNKTNENILVTSEQVLVWAKRVQAKRAHTAATNSLSELKDFF